MAEEDCIDCTPKLEAATVGAAALADGPREDPLDPTTFIAPAPLPGPSIIIEFCDRVRCRLIRLDC